jgi:hypothetical protein
MRAGTVLLVAIGMTGACGRAREQHPAEATELPVPAAPVAAEADDGIVRLPTLLGRPLVEAQAAFAHVRFSIRVPEGVPQDELREPSWKRWQAYVAGDDPFIVLVEATDTPPRTMAAYAEAARLDRDGLVVERRETLPDGSFVILLRRATNDYFAAFYSPGAHRVTCQAVYASGDGRPVADPDAMLRYVDQVCGSLTLIP